MSVAVALTVIIPTLNEQEHLGPLLTQLQQQKGVELQIIVADGGSQDQTKNLARTVEWHVTAPGRGRQMNHGALHAAHDELLFLHADSRLGHLTQLKEAVLARRAAGERAAGHFGLEFFDAPAGAERFYLHLEAKSRSNRPETINGDQGLLIHRTCFDALGGFDERLPFLEDQAISQRIFRHAQWILLPGTLKTSARRFEQEGRRSRYFLMMLIMCARRAELNSFLHDAPRLYPLQRDTKHLKVAPFLQLILDKAAHSPNFWPCMADYLLDNTWQLAFLIDYYIRPARLLPVFDRLMPLLPRKALIPVLAPLLKASFEGPILRAIERKEASQA